jgi:hypothetical protein
MNIADIYQNWKNILTINEVRNWFLVQATSKYHQSLSNNNINCSEEIIIVLKINKCNIIYKR